MFGKSKSDLHVAIVEASDGSYRYVITFNNGKQYRRKKEFETQDAAKSASKMLIAQYEEARKEFPNAMVFPFRDNNGRELFEPVTKIDHTAI